MSGRNCFIWTKTQSTKISWCFALTGQEYLAWFPIVFKQAGLQERPKQDLETFCSKDNLATLYLNHLNVMLKCPYKGGILEKYVPWNMWSELCSSAPHPLQSTGLNHHHFHLNFVLLANAVAYCDVRGVLVYGLMTGYGLKGVTKDCSGRSRLPKVGYGWIWSNWIFACP